MGFLLLPAYSGLYNQVTLLPGEKKGHPMRVARQGRSGGEKSET